MLCLTILTSGPGINQEPSVQVSGTFVNAIVHFSVGHHPAMLESFRINDDVVALESLEQYELSIDESLPAFDNVILGNSTTITIADNDGKQ